MDVPRSKEFDDVYFSAKDGLAEARYVFLEGNDLPDAWVGRGEFTICESGFGTGLNFLAVVKLWMDYEAAGRPAKLHFISFEKYPLDRDFIQKSLSYWGELDLVLAELLSVYPSDLKGGIHERYLFDDIKLTLIIGDINDGIPKLEAAVDCWFLDGFKPSNNPDMWSEKLFQNMARLSARAASFATFTAAGLVRRGLAEQGFEVRKISGFGWKREMSVGRFMPR